MIFKAWWPTASPLVEFKHGQVVVTRDGTSYRAPTWEKAIRAAVLADGISLARIERMIAEAKRARREMGSPYFGNDDARGPGA